MFNKVNSFYEKYKKFKFNKKIENDNNHLIPKIIHLTHYDKSRIPKKVWNNLEKYCNDYKIIYYSDNDCINFISKNYNNNLADIFKNLSTGAHKADLFRYCVLFKLGGIYLDIKIGIVRDISLIFDHKLEKTLYTVLSRDHIFQGIIASYPKNIIFLDLIEDFYNLDKYYFYKKMNCGHLKYHHFTQRFYYHLETKINKKLNVGNNEYLDNKVILFEEREKQINDEKSDRYGFWNIFDSLDNRIFKSRYNDYPW